MMKDKDASNSKQTPLAKSIRCDQRNTEVKLTSTMPLHPAQGLSRHQQLQDDGDRPNLIFLLQ